MRCLPCIITRGCYVHLHNSDEAPFDNGNLVSFDQQHVPLLVASVIPY